MIRSETHSLTRRPARCPSPCHFCPSLPLESPKFRSKGGERTLQLWSGCGLLIQRPCDTAVQAPQRGQVAADEWILPRQGQHLSQPSPDCRQLGSELLPLAGWPGAAIARLTDFSRLRLRSTPPRRPRGTNSRTPRCGSMIDRNGSAQGHRDGCEFGDLVPISAPKRLEAAATDGWPAEAPLSTRREFGDNQKLGQRSFRATSAARGVQRRHSGVFRLRVPCREVADPPAIPGTGPGDGARSFRSSAARRVSSSRPSHVP